MSAYLVDDSVVDYVLSAFIEFSHPYSPQLVIPAAEGEGYRQFDLSVAADRDALGQEIINENYASLAHRYGDNDEPHKYKFREHRAASRVGGLKVIVQGIKAVDNIDYQACEHPGWRKSVAREALVAIKDRLSGRLPGYEDAIWGAPEHNAQGGSVVRLV